MLTPKQQDAHSSPWLKPGAPSASRFASVAMGWLSTGVAIVATLFFGLGVVLFEPISWEFISVSCFWVLSLLSVMTFWSKISEV